MCWLDFSFDEINSNGCSALYSYSWIDPLFWLGFRKSLNFNDLYERPPEADSGHPLKQFNK